MSSFVRHPYVWKHVRDHDHRACRLGLYFLDRWRTSVELRVPRLSKFSHRDWQEILEKVRHGLEDMSIHDEITRFFRLCDQEAEREKLGCRWEEEVEAA